MKAFSSGMDKISHLTGTDNGQMPVCCPGGGGVLKLEIDLCINAWIQNAFELHSTKVTFPTDSTCLFLINRLVYYRASKTVFRLFLHPSNAF